MSGTVCEDLLSFIPGWWH